MAKELPDEADVQRIARLARLRLSDDELHRIGSELERVLTFMQELDEVDVEGVEPTFHTVDATPLREDLHRPPDASREDLLAAAPKRVDDGFAVPKVLEGDG